MVHRWATLPPRFLLLFSIFLVANGLGLLVWGVHDSVSGPWIVADVSMSELEMSPQVTHMVADRNLLYEVELAYPAPPNQADRDTFKKGLRDREPLGIRWSVHNPKGRVAAGTDADVLYVVQEHTKTTARVKSVLIASPFLPPPATLPRWVASGSGTIQVGIGQWRARAGQSYDIQVALDESAMLEPEPRFRVRARRLSWQDHVLTATPRVYAGGLLILLSVLVWTTGRYATVRMRS